MPGGTEMIPGGPPRPRNIFSGPGRGMSELKLKKFNMSSIHDDSVVVLLGKRNTGKSYVMKDLLSKHTSIPLGVVISPTESANAFFGKFVPKMFIHDEFKPAIVDNVVRRQKAVMSTMNDEVDNFGTSNVDPRGFLILDDCMFDSKWTKDVNMRYLFMNGRHVKCMLLITMQYPLGMPPILRSNVDYTFILREPSLQNRRRIFDSYAGMFNSFDLFCTVLDQSTNNYECLVIDNRVQSNRLEDQVYWYKAPSPPAQYKLCDPQYWALDKQCRRVDGGKTTEVFDLDKLKKAKINVKVVKT